MYKIIKMTEWKTMILKVHFTQIDASIIEPLYVTFHSKAGHVHKV